jgi:hypothetical protein
MGSLPDVFLDNTLRARRKLVEKILEKGMGHSVECDLIRSSYLLSPMVATYGPAGLNVAPFMVSYLVKEHCIAEALERLRDIEKKYWGKGFDAVRTGLTFVLDYVYNEKCVDPLVMVSHVMTKGHTWKNIIETGEATLGILIPPDVAAYEIRAIAEIIEQGEIYEYVNLVHDLMHVIPEGERSHPWYPAVVFRVKEIYDNSYQKLGSRIYP